MFEQVLSLLKKHKATLRVIRHEAIGTSAEVAKVRGNDPARSAKAMVIQFKTGGTTQYRLAVLPGSAQLDFDALKNILGAKPSLVSDVTTLTGCAKGTVPPFTFWDNIPLLVDQRIVDIRDLPEVLAVPSEPEGDHGQYIFFNAGALDRSMALDVNDYLRITNPQVASFSKIPEPPKASSIAFGSAPLATKAPTTAPIFAAGGPA